uniref:Uncharacterized protein n=1 Tax=Anguilla anguilla TaxID=7936 RepID=A0A0E9QQS1_ANGAN
MYKMFIFRMHYYSCKAKILSSDRSHVNKCINYYINIIIY